MRPTTRILTTVATLLAGIGILILVVALPSLSNMIELTELIAREEQRLAQIASRGLQFKDTSAQVQNIKSTLPDLYKMLIENGKEIRFFTELEQKSRAFNLAHTIRVGQSVALREIEELPIEIEVQGSFLNILRYIAELERGTILLPMRKFEIRTSAKPKNAGEQNTIAIIQTTLYVAK